MFTLTIGQIVRCSNANPLLLLIGGAKTRPALRTGDENIPQDDISDRNQWGACTNELTSVVT